MARRVARNNQDNYDVVSLDELDIQILDELQRDCRTPLQDIAKLVGHPTSTVHYRVKRLEKEGIIDGYYAKVNPEKVGMDYITVIRVIAAYGPHYYDRVGQELARVSGVWAVYYSLGEQDFFVLTRSRDRHAFMDTLDQIAMTKGVRRTKTQVITKVVHEDPRIRLPPPEGQERQKKSQSKGPEKQKKSREKESGRTE